MAHSPEFLREMADAQDEIVWETTSWDHHERGPRWYLLMGLVALGFFIYAIFTGNYLFAFLILLTVILLALTTHHQPELILVQIGHNGVVVDGHLHEFRKLHDFAIIYHPPHTKLLYLETKSAHPRIKIQLEDEDPILIRNHLKQYLPENTVLQEEHLSDILGRLFKI